MHPYCNSASCAGMQLCKAVRQGRKAQCGGKHMSSIMPNSSARKWAFCCSTYKVVVGQQVQVVLPHCGLPAPPRPPFPHVGRCLRLQARIGGIAQVACAVHPRTLATWPGTLGVHECHACSHYPCATETNAASWVHTCNGNGCDCR
jgi:hypothetical protein